MAEILNLILSTTGSNINIDVSWWAQILQWDDYQLHRLCRDGNFEVLDQFLDNKGNKNIDYFDKKGYAPIHYAIKRDTPDIDYVLGILISNDADVNVRSTKDGDTALHMIVHRFDEETAITLCLKLLSHGADPFYRNDKNRTVYDIAMARNMFTLVEYLSSDLKPQEAEDTLDTYRKLHYGGKLVDSVMDGNEEDTESCLLQGGDPDVMNQHGAAAIHYTITHCSGNKIKILGMLIDAGANIDLQDYEGDTALNLVIKTSKKRSSQETEMLVITLLNWGANASFEDVDGKTCSTLARENGVSGIDELISKYSNSDPIRPNMSRPKDTRVRPQLSKSMKRKQSMAMTSAPENDNDDYQKPDFSEEQDLEPNSKQKEKKDCIIL